MNLMVIDGYWWYLMVDHLILWLTIKYHQLQSCWSWLAIVNGIQWPSFYNHSNWPSKMMVDRQWWWSTVNDDGRPTCLTVNIIYLMVDYPLDCREKSNHGSTVIIIVFDGNSHWTISFYSWISIMVNYDELSILSQTWPHVHISLCNSHHKR